MYKYIFNIVGVKKCISLYGGYSWPDLLCGIKGDVKMYLGEVNISLTYVAFVPLI